LIRAQEPPSENKAHLSKLESDYREKNAEAALRRNPVECRERFEKK